MSPEIQWLVQMIDVIFCEMLHFKGDIRSFFGGESLALKLDVWDVGFWVSSCHLFGGPETFRCHERRVRGVSIGGGDGVLGYEQFVDSLGRSLE